MGEQAFVIAIDGPAASGKGTLARRLALELGFSHLDTGLTYRAVSHLMMQENLPLEDEERAAEIARNIDLSQLDRSILADHQIGQAASIVAAMSGVRRELVKAQRNFAHKLPGAILDGRDIASVVCPDANVKFYVTASADIRAKRRFEEIIGKGGKAQYGQIFNEIQQRDQRDMERDDSPLGIAADAHLIDTSKMDIETAFQVALAIIRKVRAG